MTTNQQTTIGAFVLGGLILAISIIVFFGNFNFFSTKQSAVIIFPGSVTGLSVGAPVTFRGVQVGSVTSINLQFDHKNHKAYIPVDITLDPNKIQTSNKSYKNFKEFLETMIKNGLCAEISTESFVTGTSNIFLDFDPKNTAQLHPELNNNLIEIPVHPSAIQKIKSELMNLQLEKLSQNLDETIIKVGRLTDNLNEQIPALIASAKKTSDSTNTLVTHIDNNVNTVLYNLNSLLVEGKVQLKNRGKQLNSVLITTNKTLTTATDALQNIKSMTSVRSQERSNLDIILRNLADAATSLRGFSTEIERNPKLLLTGRKQ